MTFPWIFWVLYLILEWMLVWIQWQCSHSSCTDDSSSYSASYSYSSSSSSFTETAETLYDVTTSQMPWWLVVISKLTTFSENTKHQTSRIRERSQHGTPNVNYLRFRLSVHVVSGSFASSKSAVTASFRALPLSASRLATNWRLSSWLRRRRSHS